METLKTTSETLKSLLERKWTPAEKLLALACALLSGVILGFLFSPSRVRIASYGSNNGNNNGNTGSDDAEEGGEEEDCEEEKGEKGNN